MPGHVLRAVEGPMAGTEIAIAGDFVVGRGETGFGNLHGDPEISRTHARIRELEGGVVLVEDLGSTNGTFVNGQRVHGQQVLRSGDRIRMGATTLVLTREGDPAPTEPGARPGPPAGAIAPPPPPAARGESLPVRSAADGRAITPA